MSTPPTERATTTPEPQARQAHMDRLLVRGIAWTGAAKYASQIVRWASTLVVVRFLAPSDYGIYAAATFFLGLVEHLTEFGVGTAVVTLRDLKDEEIAQLNGFAVLFAVGACILTAAMAEPLALFYRAPELLLVMPAMSIGFVVRSFRSIPMALLQKDLRFKLFAGFEAIDAAVLGIVMVLFAVAGFGYWTLVLGNLLGGLLGTVLLLSQRRHRIAWPRFRQIGPALSFSWQVVVSRFTWYWYSNADTVVAGRFLGKGPLGLYTFGYTLASLPVEKITALVVRVTPAFFSAVQDDNAALRRYLLSITEILSLFTIPACWGLALVADTFVPLVLGERWMGAIAPLQILAVYAAWRSIQALVHQILVVKKETAMMMWTGIVCAVVLPAAFVVGQRLAGTVGIAAAWVIVHPILSIPLYRRALRRIGLSFGGYLACVWPSAAAALVMVGAVLLVRATLPAPTLAVRLGMEVLVGAAAYVLTILVCFRERVTRFRQSLRALRKG
jgi:PST family polysaccharide transporter